MNGAHWHLVVNHLPLVFPIAGVMVLVAGFIARSETVKRTAYMIFIAGALATIAAMTTGEGAEEVAEKINGVTKDYIEAHEETAETFALLSYALGGLCVAGLWVSFKKKAYAGTAGILVLVFVFVVLFFARQTGTTGGEIRHTEIRSDYNNAAATGSDDNDRHESESK